MQEVRDDLTRDFTDGSDGRRTIVHARDRRRDVDCTITCRPLLGVEGEVGVIVLVEDGTVAAG